MTMSRAEFIQWTVSADQHDSVDDKISRAIRVADALAASGVAPWSDAPEEAPVVSAPPVVAAVADAAGDGERACKIFCRAYGRTYTWADLPELERKAWEDVATSLTGRGAGVINVEARVRETCALIVESTIREAGQAHTQLLVHVAAKIRGQSGL
jgi:hypothetical protein